MWNCYAYFNIIPIIRTDNHVYLLNSTRIVIDIIRYEQYCIILTKAGLDLSKVNLQILVKIVDFTSFIKLRLLYKLYVFTSMFINNYKTVRLSNIYKYR
jgi:hypothetical protein